MDLNPNTKKYKCTTYLKGAIHIPHLGISKKAQLLVGGKNQMALVGNVDILDAEIWGLGLHIGHVKLKY